MHLFDDFREIVKADEPLAPHVWFRLGGPAAYLARPRTSTSCSACSAAAATRDPVQDPRRRLQRPGPRRGGRGAGDPPGEPGLLRRRPRRRRVEAGAAVPLTALISQSARSGLAGLEVLTGIPGTVGGALRGNAGGRQGAIGQFVRRATVVDASDEVQVRERDDLSFAYRRVQPRRAGDPLRRVRAGAGRPRGRRPPDAADLDRQEGEPAVRPPVVRAASSRTPAPTSPPAP